MIALFHGTGLIGAAIRGQTRGKYSHASWIRGDGSTIEAWHIGGVLHSANPFVLHGLDAKFDVFAIRGLTSVQATRIEGFLMEQVGAGYDYLAIIRFLSKINRNNFNRWFCSELIAEGAETADRPLLMTEAYKISPATLSWSTEICPVGTDLGIEWWEEKFHRRVNRPVRHFDNWGVCPA